MESNSIYLDFQFAYNFYNERLFEGKLEPALLTLQRKSHMLGYISFDRFSEKNGQKYLHELAMNSDYFAYRTTIQTLSTLVHEQCHLNQRLFGKSTRKSYHDQEFKEMMMAVGLVTSQTGKEGGAQVGQKMDHYIHKKGKFLEVTIELLDMGFTLPIYERFTPTYIKPKRFYQEALEFIDEFQDVLKPEYLRPYFLNDFLLAKVQNENNVGKLIDSFITEKDAVSKPEMVVADTGLPKTDDLDLESESESIKSIDSVVHDSINPLVQDQTNTNFEVKEESIDLKVDDILDVINPIKALLQVEDPVEEEKPQKVKSKYKYSCNCELNVWGKPNMNIICGECNESFKICE